MSVLADVRDMRSKLASVDSQMSRFGKATSKIGGLIAGAFAGGAAVRGISTMVKSASDLNETISKTETIFGKSSPAIMKWANNAATSLGLSKQSALDGVSSFGNFFDQIGIGTKKTAAMSKSFVQASVDLGSFHNAAPTEVMEALSAATRGEYDSLQKFIPTINAASVEQKALAMTGKKAADELTNQDKALAVHKIVMQGQGKAAGDFARTQDSLANRTKIAKAQFDNMVATLGTKLLPIATAVMGFISEKALPALSKFGQYVQQKVVPAVKDFGKFLKENSDFLIALGSGVAVAVAALKTYQTYVLVTTKATKAWAVVQKVLNGSLRANPIGLVITAIALLVAGLVLAYKKSATFRNIVDKAWAGIKKATAAVFPVIVKVIKVAWTVISTIIKTTVKVISTVIKTAWNVIKAVTKAAWSYIKNVVLAPVRAIIALLKGNTGQAKDIMRGAWDYIKSMTSKVWDGIKTAVSTAIGKVVETVRGLKDKVTGALSGAASWLYDAGKDLIQGMINGIANMAGALLSKVTGVIDSAKNKAKALLGINSPSKVFQEYGRFVGEGLAKGLADRNQLRKVRSAAGYMATNVKDGFESPRLSLATSGGSSSAAAPIINIYAHPTNNPAELGRYVAQGLDQYYKQGGRRLAV